MCRQTKLCQRRRLQKKKIGWPSYSAIKDLNDNLWCQCDDCETPLTSPPPRCEFTYNYETTWPTSLRDASSAKQDAGEDTAAARRPRSFNFACAQACLFLHTFISLLISCCFEFFSSFLFFVGAVGAAGRDLWKVNHSAVSNKSTGTEGSDT